MAKVYITQIPHRKDKETGTLVPAVNIGPAQEHGDAVVLMPPQAAFYATADLVEQLANSLKHYDYEAGDIIIGMGDPAIMAAAFAYLGAKFGRFKIGKWDKIAGKYFLATIKV